jgi:hypothetical protein
MSLHCLVSPYNCCVSLLIPNIMATVNIMNSVLLENQLGNKLYMDTQPIGGAPNESILIA